MTRPTPTSETPAAPRTAEIVAEFYEDRDQTDERVAVENLARALARAEAAALAARPALDVDQIRLLLIRAYMRGHGNGRYNNAPPDPTRAVEELLPDAARLAPQEPTPEEPR